MATSQSIRELEIETSAYHGRYRRGMAFDRLKVFTGNANFGLAAEICVCLGMGAVSIHLQMVMTNQPKITFLVRELAFGLAVWILPSLLAHYLTVTRKIILDILDRLTIFSYIYLPLGLVSLLTVTFRLLW